MAHLQGGGALQAPRGAFSTSRSWKEATSHHLLLHLTAENLPELSLQGSVSPEQALPWGRPLHAAGSKMLHWGCHGAHSNAAEA